MSADGRPRVAIAFFLFFARIGRMNPEKPKNTRGHSQPRVGGSVLQGQIPLTKCHKKTNLLALMQTNSEICCTTQDFVAGDAENRLRKPGIAVPFFAFLILVECGC
jgi:hypothetical protein